MLGMQIAAAKEFTVAIDIGHSEKRPGAISARGVSEYHFNKVLANKVFENLADHGINAFIVDSDKELTLKMRTKIAAKKKADLFISIHADSVKPKYLKTWEYNDEKLQYSDKFSGYSIFISRKHKESGILAVILGQALREALLRPTYHHAEKIKGENRKLLNRELGIYEFGKLVVLKTATMPALLFEMGIIVNRDEEKKLSSDIYQNALAEIISNSIKEYKLLIEN